MICQSRNCERTATEKCVSKTLFGNECVRLSCPEHTCACREGTRTSLKGF